MLGSPIEHSLSPTLHHAAYAHLGLNWSYERVEVDVHGLASFVHGLDAAWRGLSLTMPLKAAVLELGQVDQVARLAGALQAKAEQDPSILAGGAGTPAAAEDAPAADEAAAEEAPAEETAAAADEATESTDA